MKGIIIFLTVIFISCNSGEAQKAERDTENLFVSYIGLFKESAIPFTLNRKELFDLSDIIYDTLSQVYKKNSYNLIPEKFNAFIPEEIKNSKVRGLFILPKIKDAYLVVIAKDLFEDDEQNAMELYLVSYDKNGKLLDYIKVAGYAIDVYDKYFEITKDFKVITKQYTFKPYPDNNPENYTYASETVTEFNIKEDGRILKGNEDTKEGYFNSTEGGYTHIKNYIN